MNSTTVAILAALALALGYLYSESGEAQPPRENYHASSNYAIAPTTPSHNHRLEQPSPRSVEPSQSSKIDACMAKENVNFDFVKFVRQEIKTSDEEIHSFYVPEKLAACGLASGQGRALGASAAHSVASGKLMQILEQSIRGMTTTSLSNTSSDGMSSETNFGVRSELAETLARGVLPIHNAYDDKQHISCACVAKRFVAADADSAISPISTSSNGSNGSALAQNAIPATPGNGFAESPPRQGRGELFDAIIVELDAALPIGDVALLTESQGVYQEVLSVNSYMVNAASSDFELQALLRFWRSDNPYELRALKMLDDEKIVISEADARALAPILHLATDESKLVFRAR